MKTIVKFRIPWNLRMLCALLILIATTAYADNKVLGEVGFEGATNLEQDSGVWVDGQYLGYLKELKGSKKVLLLPGKHQISVRHDGYKDFTQEVNLQPADKQIVRVSLEKDLQYQMPSVTAEIKLSVDPTAPLFSWTAS